MPKPPRSPLLGYNHNVKYGGHIFHVQTEDSGPGNPHLFTHLFFEGSILASKRGQYEPATPEDEVRAMMQAQHKAILKELKQAAYDERIARFFEMRGETFRADDFFSEQVQVPVAVVTPSRLPSAPTRQNPLPRWRCWISTRCRCNTDREGEHAGTASHSRDEAGRSGAGDLYLPTPLARAILQRRPPYATKPAAATRTAPVRPLTPVVVQRQVVVGGGGPAATSARKAATTPVRRRPVSGGPYVVKEGSYANIVGSAASRKAEPPPRPIAPISEAEQAPRTAEPKPPPQEGAPSAFVTDQSLDDVILAYLSQGERKR